MIEPLALSDPAARDKTVVGSKAALLAVAAEAGMPVLPGIVVPLAASAPAMTLGAEALTSGGRAAAYLAASREAPSKSHVNALASVADAVVVRSSTLLDDDGRWAGAFASYLDVGAGDVAAAVRGCWSSAFARDALDRCEAAGQELATLRIAVLAQPWLRFAYGGTARIGPSASEDGTDITVTVAVGGAHGVVAGKAATTVVVGRHGELRSDGHVHAGIVAEVAALARRALDVTGIGTIEWGATGERVVVLQVGPAPPPIRSQAVRPRAASVSISEDVVPIAATVARFRGALAQELVLPWAIAAPPLDASAVAVTDPAAAVAEVRGSSTELIGTAWGRGTEEARRVAARVLHDLRSGELQQALALITGARAPTTDDARRVIGLIRGIGEALQTAGVLPAAELVWQLSHPELDAAVAGAPQNPRSGPDRWEPFLADVAFDHGTTVEATAITDGVGAGRLHVIAGLRDIGRPGPRTILAAPAPLPHLAPLLWHCAGFIAHDGSAGAHLFEVARSLGVPAVIGVAPSDLGPPGSLVAVDGTAGVVACLDGTDSARVRRSA